MKIFKLSEQDLQKIVKRVMKEQETQRYMFFSNLQQMRRQCDLLLDLDKQMVESILENGHDWAQDHIAEAKNNMDQVFDFLMNETKSTHKMQDEVSYPTEVQEYDNEEKLDTALAVSMTNPNLGLALSEGRKKSGTKLCARGKSAAKSKFKVYPSAYANGYAVQVCKGKIKGLDGKKKCSSPYC